MNRIAAVVTLLGVGGCAAPGPTPADLARAQYDQQAQQIRDRNDATLRSYRAGMPYYFTYGHCQRISSVGGGTSEVIRNGCLQQEQSSYDALKPVWNTLPEDLRLHCEGIAAEGNIGNEGSYFILRGCVQQELDAAARNRAFKFRR